MPVCLAKLIFKEGDGETVLLDSVCTIEVDGAKLRAINLFGKSIETTGTLARGDFQDSRVLIVMSGSATQTG